MENKKDIIEQLNLYMTFRMIAQVYEENSISQIKLARDSVLSNREFLGHLLEVYHEVENAYHDQISAMIFNHNSAKLPGGKSFGIAKNGRTLCVLLSANTKLNGDIVKTVFQKFENTVGQQDVDVMIVGRLGMELYKEHHINKKYYYFELPDGHITLEDLKPIIFHMVKYESVNVFHGEFQNIITQRPVETTIAGKSIFEGAASATKDVEKYLFEPSLDEILSFFQTQFFTTLFKQSVFESELARHASRVKAMDESLETIKGQEKKLMVKKLILKRRGEQKKQLERVAAISQW